MKTLIQKIKKNKGFRNFLIRMSIFFLLFGTISAFYTDLKKLLDQATIIKNDSFTSFIFYFIVFLAIYINKDKIYKIKNYKNKIIESTIFIILAILCFIFPYELLAYKNIVHPTIAYFLFFCFGQFFLFIAIFGIIFIKKLFQTEILITLLIIMINISLILFIENSWNLVYPVIEIGMKPFIKISNIPYEIETLKSAFQINLKDFSGIVGPSCSGIYSMTAFFILFLASLMLLSQKVKINKLKAVIAILSALILLYILNILRILTIVYIGAYYSPELAINLFHEYLSAIFLMGLFIIYLQYVIPKLIDKK